METVSRNYNWNRINLCREKRASVNKKNRMPLSLAGKKEAWIEEKKGVERKEIKKKPQITFH